MTPDVLVGLLAEPSRMRVFAAVVLGADTPADVVAQTNLTVREVTEALRRLADGGLVSPAPPLRAKVDAFKEAARQARQTSRERERAGRRYSSGGRQRAEAGP
jgi:DNA-binding transcriptional ArsR family regulator